jgi:hypothetical protein
MQLLLTYSLPQNLTIKASVPVVTTYYISVSDTAVVSVFISAETETSSNCRRCLAMDVRVDSYNQPLSGTPQYKYVHVFKASIELKHKNDVYFLHHQKSWQREKEYELMKLKSVLNICIFTVDASLRGTGNSGNKGHCPMWVWRSNWRPWRRTREKTAKTWETRTFEKGVVSFTIVKQHWRVERVTRVYTFCLIVACGRVNYKRHNNALCSQEDLVFTMSPYILSIYPVEHRK